jgi:hypothetical protein
MNFRTFCRFLLCGVSCFWVGIAAHAQSAEPKPLSLMKQCLVAPSAQRVTLIGSLHFGLAGWRLSDADAALFQAANAQVLFESPSGQPIDAIRAGLSRPQVDGLHALTSAQKAEVKAKLMALGLGEQVVDLLFVPDFGSLVLAMGLQRSVELAGGVRDVRGGGLERMIVRLPAFSTNHLTASQTPKRVRGLSEFAPLSDERLAARHAQARRYVLARLPKLDCLPCAKAVAAAADAQHAAYLTGDLAVYEAAMRVSLALEGAGSGNDGDHGLFDALVTDRNAEFALQLLIALRQARADEQLLVVVGAAHLVNSNPATDAGAGSAGGKGSGALREQLLLLGFKPCAL